MEFDEDWICKRLASLVESFGDYQKVEVMPYEDQHEFELEKDGRVYRVIIIGERVTG